MTKKYYAKYCTHVWVFVYCLIIIIFSALSLIESYPDSWAALARIVIQSAMFVFFIRHVSGYLVEVDQENHKIRLKPGKLELSPSCISTVEVVRNRSGKIKYMLLRMGQYEFHRVQVADPDGLLSDILALNQSIIVKEGH